MFINATYFLNWFCILKLYWNHLFSVIWWNLYDVLFIQKILHLPNLDILCFWSSKKSFQLFSSSLVLAIGLSCMDFIILRYVAPVTSLLRVLSYHKRKLNFVKCFSFILDFILCVVHVGLCILKHACSPGITSPWSWWMILSVCFWVQFDNPLFRIFASVFIRSIGW